MMIGEKICVIFGPLNLGDPWGALRPRVPVETVFQSAISISHDRHQSRVSTLYFCIRQGLNRLRFRA